MTLGTIFYHAQMNGWQWPAPPIDTTVVEELQARRQWLWSTEYLDYMKEKGKSRGAHDVRLWADYNLEQAIAKGTMSVCEGSRGAAANLGGHHGTQCRRRNRAAEVGLCNITKREGAASMVDFTPMPVLTATVNTITEIENTVAVSAVDEDDHSFIQRHRLHNVFTTYPYRLAQRRRQGHSGDTVLCNSVGAIGLSACVLMRHGIAFDDLCEQLGRKERWVYKLLGSLKTLSLIVYRDGKWWLADNFEELLGDDMPQLVTYQVNQGRAGKSDVETARNLRTRAYHEDDFSKKAWLLRRADQLERRGNERLDRCEANGYDARMKVGSKPLPKDSLAESRWYKGRRVAGRIPPVLRPAIIKVPDAVQMELGV